MNITEKVIQAYFNYAYNPVYDFVATQPTRYEHLQRTCVDKLELKDEDTVLCVGVGTGNEIYHLLQTNKNINIVGVDLSRSALERARNKVTKTGTGITLLRMDAACLDFLAESFDKVVCIHLMDFTRDNKSMTKEIS